MSFGNLGFTEILLIAVVVLLLFGAKRLPEIGASMGKGIREFKKNISDAERNLREPDRSERLSEPPRDPVAERVDEKAKEPKRLLS